MQHTELLPDATLRTMTAAEKAALLQRVATSLAEHSASPDGWYDELARFTDGQGGDWDTAWSTRPGPDAPHPPENLDATLGGQLRNMAATQRAIDITMATLTTLAERAVTSDRESVLGVPKGIGMWRTGHGYVAEQFGIETRQAATYKDRAEIISPTLSTLDRPSTGPLLPQVAEAYRQGRVPSQNIDSIARSLATITKYLRAVGLKPDNIQEIVTALDEPLRNAAVSVRPGEMAKMTDDMLSQVAAIVDADGPPPAELLHRVENSLDYRIVNGKLKLEMITDAVNLELFLGIIIAGLNFRAHHNRYAKSPQDAQRMVDDLLSGAAQEASQSFLADLRKTLGDDATDEQLVAAAKEWINDELNSTEVHAETMDGEKPDHVKMKRLDNRTRPERQHDVFMSFLKATGRLDPSIHGLHLFNGSATQLRIALDYQTFADQLGDRLPAEYHLDESYRRPDGMAGFDAGPARSLQGVAFAAEQLIELDHDDDATLIELQTPDGTIRLPKPKRGHPFIARGMLTGNIPPQHLRSMLCDAQVIPQILGGSSVELDKGRAARTFPNHLKEDLALRGACSIPNCRSPVAYTEGHHLIWWSHGGLTNASNMTLVCSSCHDLVHKGTWIPVLDGNGELYWKPAAWLDPEQTPLRNTYWD